jgi:hypothetical protein
MSTAVSVNTHAHTVTYVATKMMMSLKELIRLVGLDPSKLTAEWKIVEEGIATWLGSQHLRQVALEIFSSSTDKLVTRWDIDVNYGYGGDGSFWTDTAALRYAIAKAGELPSGCSYRVMVNTAPGAATVSGWSSSSYRSTDGMSRYGVGATIGADGIAAETSYWRKA